MEIASDHTEIIEINDIDPGGTFFILTERLDSNTNEPVAKQIKMVVDGTELNSKSNEKGKYWYVDIVTGEIGYLMEYTPVGVVYGSFTVNKI